MKGKCWINVSPAAKTALAAASANETSMVIEDDESDGEPDFVEKPVIAPAPAVVIAPVVVQAPAIAPAVVEQVAVPDTPVVKKKIVRKKD